MGVRSIERDNTRCSMSATHPMDVDIFCRPNIPTDVRNLELRIRPLSLPFLLHSVADKVSMLFIHRSESTSTTFRFRRMRRYRTVLSSFHCCVPSVYMVVCRPSLKLTELLSNSQTHPFLRARCDRHFSLEELPSSLFIRSTTLNDSSFDF